MRRPPIIWQTPGAEWAADLRGRSYFKRKAGVQVVPSEGGEMAVSRSTMIILYMPVNKPFPNRLIADVTADVLGLLGLPGGRGRGGGPNPAMRAAWEARITTEAAAYWRRPEILAGHKDALRSSTLIITSWAEMVEPLFEFANRPVVYLPDYQGRFGWAFRRAMRHVWRELEAVQAAYR